MQTEQSTGEQLVSNSEIEPESVAHATKDQNIHPQTSMESTSSPGGCSCGSQTGKMPSPPSYVYALGQITHRFPNRSVEAEFYQATSGSTSDTSGITMGEMVYKSLAESANRYLARQSCYTFKIGGIETYILMPRDVSDLDKFVQALNPAAGLGDIDLIIGRRGPIATAEMCNGLLVPIVIVDQIYSFDRDTLIKAIPKPKGETEDRFKKTAEEFLNNIMQITDNAGATDEHRAINYLAVRYDKIYNTTQSLQNENYSFTNIDVKPSALSGTRKILEVIFSYENRASRAVQKFFARVDVTELFPFLVSPLQQYVDIKSEYHLA
jgi:hypothetical protein